LGYPEGGKFVSGLFGHFKHCFIVFTKVAFCDIQTAENEFAGLYDHLKHIFIDLIKFAFYDGQKTDHEFSRPS
jgi:hypothetical protein